MVYLFNPVLHRIKLRVPSDSRMARGRIHPVLALSCNVLQRRMSPILTLTRVAAVMWTRRDRVSTQARRKETHYKR